MKTLNGLRYFNFHRVEYTNYLAQMFQQSLE